MRREKVKRNIFLSRAFVDRITKCIILSPRPDSFPNKLDTLFLALIPRRQRLIAIMEIWKDKFFHEHTSDDLQSYNNVEMHTMTVQA